MKEQYPIQLGAEKEQLPEQADIFPGNDPFSRPLIQITNLLLFFVRLPPKLLIFYFLSLLVKPLAIPLA